MVLTIVYLAMEHETEIINPQNLEKTMEQSLLFVAAAIIIGLLLRKQLVWVYWVV